MARDVFSIIVGYLIMVGVYLGGMLRLRRLFD